MYPSIVQVNMETCCHQRLLSRRAISMSRARWATPTRVGILFVRRHCTCVRQVEWPPLADIGSSDADANAYAAGDVTEEVEAAGDVVVVVGMAEIGIQ